MDLHSRANHLPVRAARRQVIEGFIDYLPISMRGVLAGQVSGGLLYPEAEMFKDLPYYLRIGNETDDLHLPSAARTAEGVRLIGEVPFYLAAVKDPAGSKSLLEILDKRFALGLEFEDIDQQIRELNMGIEELKSQNHDINRYLQLLEQGIALSQEEGETLAREVAGFLRQNSWDG